MSSQNGHIRFFIELGVRMRCQDRVEGRPWHFYDINFCHRRHEIQEKGMV